MRARRTMGRIGIAGSLLAALALGCATAPEEHGIPTAKPASRNAAAGPAGPLRPEVTNAPAPQTPEEALPRAEERYAVGDEAGAVDILSQALAKSPGGPGSDAARLRLAELEQRRGHTAAAANALGRVRIERLSPEQQRRGVRLQATIAREEGDRPTEIAKLAELRASAQGADEVSLIDVDLDEAIGKLTLADAARAASLLGERPPAARVRLREVELALQARDLDHAMLALAEASRLPLTPQEAARIPPLESQVHALEEQGTEPPPPAAFDPSLPLPPQRLPRPAPPPFTMGAHGVLGVVLPLSGPGARFGEESLNGILLAARLPREGASEADDVLRVLVRDSKGTPTGAAAAVTELAALPEVSALLGPLGAEEAEAAATAAETAGVPLLALSPREDVSHDRPHVFRVGVAPRGEADALAEYAVHGLGLRRLAVLHPNDAYGHGFSQVFEDAVRARGGEIVSVASYPAHTTDFTATIHQLVAQAPKAAPAPTPPVASTPTRGAAPPLIAPAPMDAIFIADSREVADVLVPQLAYNDLGGVRILGPRGWAEADLVSVAGKQVEGAILAEPFDPSSPEPLVHAFVERYRRDFGEAPDVFAAQAYDAATLALAQLASGGTSREGMRAGLARVREVPGVAGATTIASDGNAQKRAFLIAIVNGELRAIPTRYEDAPLD